MNHDCNGDEFERWGKTWRRCLLDSTIYEVTHLRLNVCPNCERLWEGTKASKERLEKIMHIIEYEIDLPHYRELAKKLGEENGMLYALLMSRREAVSNLCETLRQEMAKNREAKTHG